MFQDFYGSSTGTRVLGTTCSGLTGKLKGWGALTPGHTAKKNGQKSRTPGRPFCSLPLPELWSRSVDLCETQGFLPNAELCFILFPCLDWSAEKALFAVSSSWSKLQTSWKPLIFLLTTCVFLEKSVTVNEATSCRGPNGPRDDAQFRAWQCWNLKAKKDAHCVTKTRNEMVMK